MGPYVYYQSRLLMITDHLPNYYWVHDIFYHSLQFVQLAFSIRAVPGCPKRFPLFCVWELINHVVHPLVQRPHMANKGAIFFLLAKYEKFKIRITTESTNTYLPPANEVCEGYVFTGVCLSTGGRAWLLRGVCMVAPGGGLCVVAPRGRAWLLGGRAWFFRWDTVNERAVRILLECILVCD